ncbi:MAG: tyrosine-type recombinase/integrase [Phycicoccus sp.]|uniref:tyrosine-type recombinase/integrase n=1 Tax=Phycicoccus sp. TaxID=1902410 RepID=UPI002588646C|nr:tyrosine-type recombinase/integrase [Phycicoccus sp.]MCO5303581.1 tyrosine-type recombinase/integrase [Phycicoccus sp.]
MLREVPRSAGSKVDPDDEGEYQMAVSVQVASGEYHLFGDWGGVSRGNDFLSHLRARAFAAATVRAYAYDVANFARFLEEHEIALVAVEPMDVFAWVDWQGARTPATTQTVVRLKPRSAAPATINRRVAAVRAFFEFLVMSGLRESNPVPAPRRGQGLRPTARGMLGHLGPGRARGGGRLVREQRRLPESLDLAEVQVFLSGLRTHRDRAMVLAMLLGGLRSAEVRGLLLADVDQGRRRLRVIGKGGRERVVPVDAVFFAELAAYLRHERPPGLATAECFVVLRGPTTGAPVSEAGLRSLFRRHRAASGAIRVRPHRLRHTYGTELAAAGIDLLALRELMGHASPETTSRYVHLSTEHLAAEYAAARATLAGSR